MAKGLEQQILKLCHLFEATSKIENPVQHLYDHITEAHPNWKRQEYPPHTIDYNFKLNGVPVRISIEHDPRREKVKISGLVEFEREY